MQRLEVSVAVQLIYRSLGVKGLKVDSLARKRLRNSYIWFFRHKFKRL